MYGQFGAADRQSATDYHRLSCPGVRDESATMRSFSPVFDDPAR